MTTNNELSTTNVTQNKANTKPIQTQTKPISEKPKMSLNKVSKKDYDNNPALPLRQNKPNSNPIPQEPKMKVVPHDIGKE
jgi:hypothetical protein